MAKKTKLNLEPESDDAIQFGNVELDSDEFAPQHTKVRLSMWIDEDLLQAIKGRARKEGDPKYQTWLNRYLRSMILDESLFRASNEDLRGAIKLLEKRLDALERSRKKRA